MATVSGGIKINGAVSASGTANNSTSAAFYTAPATGYAIVNVSYTNTGSGAIQVLVAGRKVLFPTSGNISGPQNSAFNIYVGPSQAVTCFAAVSTTITVEITGVEFINF